MRISNPLKVNNQFLDQEKFLRQRAQENMQKGKILAAFMIAFDFVLALFDIIFWLANINVSFHFAYYLTMYLLMISLNALFLFFIRKNNIQEASVAQLHKFEIYFTVYVTLVMIWGSVVSIMDQILYGQLLVFMINMIAGSVIFLLPSRKMLYPFLCSSLVLFIGLPLAQRSGNILIGHYINLSIFIVTSWLASRLIYISSCNNMVSKELLKQSNLLLQNKIEENYLIHEQLLQANQQLKVLSSIDELTGIPNRRSFNNYVHTTLSMQKGIRRLASILMIDIDLFKEYNDSYGHISGDKVLITIADIINNIAKQHHHFAARFGGEEFIYIAFDADKEAAVSIATAIKNATLQQKIPHTRSKDASLSVSVGIYTTCIAGENEIENAVILADKALYQAKACGRNRVCTYEQIDSEQE